MLRSAEHWCRDAAGGRIHGTTRRVPREVFEAEERAAMLPAPAEPFDVPLWVEDAKVHPDHHVQRGAGRCSPRTPLLFTLPSRPAPPGGQGFS